jgi:uncharacterized OB-fold protein
MMIPSDFPLPDPDFAPLAPLWEGARISEFRLPRCTTCGRFDWYPTGQCRGCNGDEINWTVLSGRGFLHSWAVVHRALHPSLKPLNTYISAIIRVAEDPKTRFVTRLVDTPLDRIHADMPVQVRFVDAGYPEVETGTIAPLFAAANIDQEQP